MGYAKPEDPLCAVATPEELAWLSRMAQRNGYLAPTPMGDGWYCCMVEFAFTWGLIKGRMFDDYGYADRWCYHDYATCLGAIVLWQEAGFEGEPIGWHRHPDSGRRRPDGDASREYVNP